MMITQPQIIFATEEELDAAYSVLGVPFMSSNGLQKVGVFPCGVTFVVARQHIGEA